jgi:hypothetical protein
MGGTAAPRESAARAVTDAATTGAPDRSTTRPLTAAPASSSSRIGVPADTSFALTVRGRRAKPALLTVIVTSEEWRSASANWPRSSASTTSASPPAAAAETRARGTASPAAFTTRPWSSIGRDGDRASSAAPRRTAAEQTSASFMRSVRNRRCFRGGSGRNTMIPLPFRGPTGSHFAIKRGGAGRT